jgi:hypothetical protein
MLLVVHNLNLLYIILKGTHIMGLKQLAPGGYRMAKSMYGFNKDNYESLEAAAEAAVNRIYTPGMMIHNGRVIPGGNNVMADFAAEAFNENDLATLEAGSHKSQQFAEIIRLRQEIMRQDNYYTETSLALFRHTYGRIQLLKEQDNWKPREEIHSMHGPRPV